MGIFLFIIAIFMIRWQNPWVLPCGSFGIILFLLAHYFSEHPKIYKAAERRASQHRRAFKTRTSIILLTGYLLIISSQLIPSGIYIYNVNIKLNNQLSEFNMLGLARLWISLLWYMLFPGLAMVMASISRIHDHKGVRVFKIEDIIRKLVFRDYYENGDNV
jgi:hypothetical protein